ncbi:MAG TPA: hypothetical protein PK239_06320 [Chitinophagales bacterium]|nr:hypothetical protein [Chitinophagales bacterium]HRK26890.1 hypothetical protein [Chitinophagales bacterium]
MNSSSTEKVHKVLFELQFLNDYYKTGICPNKDLQVVPMPSTQKLFDALKLSLKCYNNYQWQVTTGANVAGIDECFSKLKNHSLQFILIATYNKGLLNETTGLEACQLILSDVNAIYPYTIVSKHNIQDDRSCAIGSPEDQYMMQENRFALQVAPMVTLNENLLQKAKAGIPVSFRLYFPRLMARRVYVWKNKEYATVKKYLFQEHETQPIEEEAHILSKLYSDNWTHASVKLPNTYTPTPILPTPKPENLRKDPIFPSEFCFKINLT